MHLHYKAEGCGNLHLLMPTSHRLKTCMHMHEALVTLLLSAVAEQTFVGNLGNHIE